MFYTPEWPCISVRKGSVTENFCYCFQLLDFLYYIFPTCGQKHLSKIKNPKSVILNAEQAAGKIQIRNSRVEGLQSLVDFFSKTTYINQRREKERKKS